MLFSICSYSFHRLLEAGQQDIFRYIADCKTLGAAELDPWNAHLAVVRAEDAIAQAGRDPAGARLSAQSDAYLDRVKAAADEAGLPFGCIAVDGAHIYEETAEQRAHNRAVATRWLDVAERLGARQVRIDAGGPADMPDDVFSIIVDGYRDLVARAADKGLEVLIENHWGPSRLPENVIKILEAVDGLGLLLDTNNWTEGRQHDGWVLGAPHARACHIKTFSFDAAGYEPSVDLAEAITLLQEAGYDGVWGIESCPTDGDEYAGVRQTIALIERVLNA